MESINPVSGERVAVFERWDSARLDTALAATAYAAPLWAQTPLERRCELLLNTAHVLRERSEELARLITLEMGKLIAEARAEVEKCALGCEFYAHYAPAFLADELVASDAGRSYVAYQPLGTILAVMPWNFPLWQVMRFAAPALVAGNTALLKHASNVPQCALAIESVLCEAGAPPGVFQTLMIASSEVRRVIADPRVHAVTLTGSEPAGRDVAAAAGAALKKTVLELGGSDPFVVLADADLEFTAQRAVTARFANAGQSCIAAKRFIVVDEVAEEFLAHFRAGAEALRAGDPANPVTTLAPLARRDLCTALDAQVRASIEHGAKVITGCAMLPGAGAWYAPSILDQVTPGMPAFDEELFGPVAAVCRARDEEEAIALANRSRFGLGASVWTRDSARGERVALRLQSGSVFVNGVVKSDPRLPFGGIKDSGYGRELSSQGLREFVNVRTVWIR
jgi:succinate-semialdehyde dehydrogenase/glutarate-semialdehyde dehydrogenase